MKRTVLIFIGLFLFLVTIGCLAFSGAIYTLGTKMDVNNLYDTGSDIPVQAYFFQPNNLPERRVGVPAMATDFDPDKMRDLLVKKYVTEYFSVTPNISDIKRRQSRDSFLREVSKPIAYRKWEEQILPELTELASQNVVRTVSVVSITPPPPNIEYWDVVYELKTWPVSNDFSVVPNLSRGIIRIKFSYEPGVYPIKGGMTRWLEEGHDPATVFRFDVFDTVLGQYESEMDEWEN